MGVSVRVGARVAQPHGVGPTPPGDRLLRRRDRARAFERRARAGSPGAAPRRRPLQRRAAVPSLPIAARSGARDRDAAAPRAAAACPPAPCAVCEAATTRDRRERTFRVSGVNCLRSDPEPSLPADRSPGARPGAGPTPARAGAVSAPCRSPSESASVSFHGPAPGPAPRPPERRVVPARCRSPPESESVPGSESAPISRAMGHRNAGFKRCKIRQIELASLICCWEASCPGVRAREAKLANSRT